MFTHEWFNIEKWHKQSETHRTEETVQIIFLVLLISLEFCEHSRLILQNN